jgi:hypothetical protein
MGDLSVVTSRCLKCRSYAIPKEVTLENKGTNELRSGPEPVSAVNSTSELDGAKKSASDRMCAKRKCQTVLELSYELKTCRVCLEKDRTTGKIKREKVKADNESRSGTDDRACTACLKTFLVAYLSF